MRGIADSIRVLGQMRRHLSLTERVIDEIDTLEDDFMLASSGVTGDAGAVGRRASEWLDQFRGAEETLLSGL